MEHTVNGLWICESDNDVRRVLLGDISVVNVTADILLDALAIIHEVTEVEEYRLEVHLSGDYIWFRVELDLTKLIDSQHKCTLQKDNFDDHIHLETYIKAFTGFKQVSLTQVARLWGELIIFNEAEFDDRDWQDTSVKGGK